MTTKHDMLARLRSALGRREVLRDAPTPPPPPLVTDELVRLVGPGDDLPGVFAARAAEVGMQVVQCGATDVTATVIGVLREADVQRVVCSVNQLDGALRDAGIDVRDWRNDPSMADEFEAGAAVTGVAAALAETGTLICCADARHGRGLSLVPPLHLAIVYHHDIVPDMLDYFRQAAGAAPPSAQVLITGPSKTADIEGVLVRGVHGPGKVVIVLVADA
jgi:L-lactate dehydrogenase complex protein LldG